MKVFFIAMLAALLAGCSKDTAVTAPTYQTATSAQDTLRTVFIGVNPRWTTAGTHDDAEAVIFQRTAALMVIPNSGGVRFDTASITFFRLTPKMALPIGDSTWFYFDSLMYIVAKGYPPNSGQVDDSLYLYTMYCEPVSIIKQKH